MRANDLRSLLVAHVPFALALGAIALCAACGPTRGATTATSAALGFEGEPAPVEPGGTLPVDIESSLGQPPVDRFAPIEEAPWTGAFEGRAILVGRTIRVEGPEGLLKHIVVASADEMFDRTVETTAEGFLQVVRRAGDAVVRGQLDAWKLAADERILVLERIAPGPVVVTADGGAVWRDIDGHEHRAERIQLVGEIGKMERVRPASQDGAGFDAGTNSATDAGNDANTDRANGEDESEESSGGDQPRR